MWFLFFFSFFVQAAAFVYLVVMSTFVAHAVVLHTCQISTNVPLHLLMLCFCVCLQIAFFCLINRPEPKDI